MQLIIYFISSQIFQIIFLVEDLYPFTAILEMIYAIFARQNNSKNDNKTFENNYKNDIHFSLQYLFKYNTLVCTWYALAIWQLILI